MFDSKNNDISTVLLLIVLGLLIWYLTKPSNTECSNENFTNSKKNKNQYQELNQPLLESHEVIPFEDLTRGPLTIKNETVPHSQEPVLTQGPVVNQGPVLTQGPVVNQGPVLTQGPVVNQGPIVTQGVNNFEGIESNYSDSGGADINMAFKPQVPTTGTVISAVDINKKNVQNYNAKDFLPKEINDQWFDTDFSQAKTNIQDDKLINTERYVIGINTVGQSLKNASYDIRGTIANPKFSVSPWNNSTYEPDYNIKPMC